MTSKRVVKRSERCVGGMGPDMQMICVKWLVFRYDDGSYKIMFVDHQTQHPVDVPSSIAMTNLINQERIPSNADNGYMLGGECNAVMTWEGRPAMTFPEAVNAL